MDPWSISDSLVLLEGQNYHAQPGTSPGWAWRGPGSSKAWKKGRLRCDGGQSGSSKTNGAHKHYVPYLDDHQLTIQSTTCSDPEMLPLRWLFPQDRPVYGMKNHWPRLGSTLWPVSWCRICKASWVLSPSRTNEVTFFVFGKVGYPKSNGLAASLSLNKWPWLGVGLPWSTMCS